MAKLTDIRGSKIRVSSKSESAAVQNAAFLLGFENANGGNNAIQAHCSFIMFCVEDTIAYTLSGDVFRSSPKAEIFFRNGEFHDCEKTISTEMLLDIQKCKIKIGGFTPSKIEQLKSALSRFDCCTGLVDSGYNFIFIREHGDIFLNSKIYNFETSSFKEIFLHNGDFYDYDIEKVGNHRPSPVDAVLTVNASEAVNTSRVEEIVAKLDAHKSVLVSESESNKANQDHQPGDVVFNKNGYKYEAYLCQHPLDPAASLCQCEGGDIIGVLNSALVSYSGRLELIKRETDNAKKLYDEYVNCVNKANPMAIMLPFENIGINGDGVKVWVEFAKRVTINEK